SDPNSGGSQAFVAGTTFTVTVNGADPYFNTVSAVNAQIHVVTTDSHDIEPADQPLVNGTTQFVMRYFTADPVGWQIHVSTVSGDGLADDISPAMPVAPNTSTRLLLVAPNEVYDP